MPYRVHMMVCAGTGCVSNRSLSVRDALEKEIHQRGLAGEIQVVTTGCNGFCGAGPIAVVQPDGIFYQQLTPQDIPYLVEEHLLKGRPVQKFMYVPPEEKAPIPRISEIPFFKGQRLIALRNRGLIDPEKIDEYIARDGYTAFVKALTQMTPDEIIAEIKTAGLRGRGGAGFTTGVKWERVRQASGEPKYIICNGDEGDPGAFMDRSIFESDPHSVIEGMLIGARAIGARWGVVYIRNEYPLALQRIQIAIDQAREYGLLGENIFETDYSFDISVTRGAGAFVCGEETALIASVEGRLGDPRARPPYPAEYGLWGKPTCINNVETWANVAPIIMRGAKWYTEIGTETSKGTKVFSLVGKINNTGLVEVPMGITLRELIYDIGGGIPGGKRFKAAQTGGPSGGCIPAGPLLDQPIVYDGRGDRRPPADALDLPIDYESLTEVGSMMGSGGLVVMDEDTCMVDLSRYFLGFTQDESCGACTPCREGTKLMLDILTKITAGHGTMEDLASLEEIARIVKQTSLCGLGKTAPNPVLTTLRYFRHEYERHLRDKRCDAFVCKGLVGAPCQSACPLGTEAWRYVAHLARGEYDEAYRVIRETNPFPSVCARVCDHQCEERCRLSTTGSPPVAIRALKRFVTDRVDRAVYKPARVTRRAAETAAVAVVGSGPAGLTAAHYLSLDGYKVTVFEADHELGGMLISGIPAYRLPRDVLRKEIASLIDANVTVKCGQALGRHFTIDDLFAKGYQAIFLALGAHKSRQLNIEGEDLDGVYPAIEFLRAFNLHGKQLAKGRVGIIGGGNSAVDAARTALRQEGVESVRILYRRTRPEMPALTEEVTSALQEGIRLETLVSPTRILSANGRLSGVEFVRNELGDPDSSGRRRPVPLPGTEFSVPLDTLIAAISEEPDIDYIPSMRIEVTRAGVLRVDPETLATSRQGVFAGGDVVTGPNTVVDAIAAGKKAAVMIARYLRGEEMRQPAVARVPSVYVKPYVLSEEERSQIRRAQPPGLPMESRKRGFSEVELPLSAEDAVRETRRCLRCDLEFTEPKESETARRVTGARPV